MGKLFTALLFLSTLVFSQSFHTITIDGTNDFSAGETLPTGTSGYTAYITWDKDNLYLGYSGTDIGDGESGSKWIVFYFDTDPAENPKDASDSGTDAAVSFNTQNWTLPFNADYFAQFATNESLNKLSYYSGGVWNENASPGMSIFDNDSGNFIEIKIPLSSLGNAKQLNIIGYFINETSGGEWTYASFPSGTNTDGYQTAGEFTSFQNFYLIEQVTPQLSGNENNYQWLLRLNASTSSLSDTNIYAGMALNATDNFDTGFDIAKPPAPSSNYLEIFFERSDWTSALGPRFSRDMKKLINLDSTTSIWNFKISTDKTSETVTVNISEYDFIPSNYDIKLYDTVADSTHNLLSKGAYTYTTGTTSENRQFRLIIGTTLTAPNINVNSQSFDFGSVKTNADSTMRLTVSNSGDSTLVISNIISSDNNLFSFSGGTSYSILSNNSIDIDITFTPAYAASFNETLTIVNNDPDSDTLTIALSGTGLQLYPNISASVSSIDFGNVKVDYDSSITFKIFNTGDTALTVSNIFTADNHFSVIGPSSFTLNVNDSTTRTVKFSPAAVTDYSASLFIISDDPETDTLSIAINGTGVKSTVTNTFTAGWHLMSIPVSPDNPSASGVIGDDASNFLLYNYNQSGGYFPGDSLFAGNGYWLGLENSADIDVTGTPEIDSVSTALHGGWNIISSPYIRKFPISAVQFRKDGGSWNSASAAASSGWIENNYYSFNESDTSYISADTLRQWSGYWFAALVSGLDMGFVHADAVGSPLKKSNRNKRQNNFNNWEIPIFAELNGAKDNLLKFGVNENAANGFDIGIDKIKPPISPQNVLETYFLKEDWNQFFTKYSADIQSCESGVQWRFYLYAGQSGKVNLSWENTEQIDGNYDYLMLVSAPLAISIDMLTNGGISFTAEAGQTYEFFINPIMVGVNETGNNLSFELNQNYPNPFNPSTTIVYEIPQSSFVTIDIYDALGGRITKLVNAEKSAGRYEINFNASELASGMYFYRITAGNFTAVKKMLLLK